MTRRRSIAAGLVALLVAPGMALGASVMVNFKGLMVVALEPIEEPTMPPTTASEVRVLLPDSDYPGNANEHRMSHVPMLVIEECTYAEVQDKTCTVADPPTPAEWAMRRPSYVWPELTFEEWKHGAQAWRFWDLRDTVLRFERRAASAPVTLVNPETFRTPNFCHTGSKRERLTRLRGRLWDAADEKIGARVDLDAGTIAVTSTATIDVDSQEVEIATDFTWADVVERIVLSGFEGERPLHLALPRAANVAWIVNLPAMEHGDLDTAAHYPEYYDFTAKAVTNSRARPRRTSTVKSRFPWEDEDDQGDVSVNLTGVHDAFCPPALLWGVKKR